MKNETFREIAATLSYPMPQTNKQRARTLTLRDNSFMTPGTEVIPTSIITLMVLALRLALPMPQATAMWVLRKRTAWS